MLRNWQKVVPSIINVQKCVTNVIAASKAVRKRRLHKLSTISNQENFESEETNQNDYAKKHSKQENTNLVVQYLNSIDEGENLIEQFPSNMVKETKKVKNFYLANKQTAKQIASIIKDRVEEMAANKLLVFHEILKGKSIIEVNSGIGLLTKELLKVGVSNIDLYGTQVKFPALTHLVQTHPERLKMVLLSITNLWLSNYDNKHKERFLQNRKIREWEDQTFVTIVGILKDFNFIDTIIKTFVRNIAPSCYGRIEAYAVMKPSHWAKLSAKPGIPSLYKWRAVIFQLFFNYELIEKLDRKAFIPWVKVSNRKYAKSKAILELEHSNYMVLVRMEPKSDLFKSVLEKEHLIPFWHFVRHIMANSHTRIIPELEKWFPGCGPYLIMKLGIHIFTTSGEMLPHQVLDLFKQITLCPEYDRNLFLEHISTAHAKDHDLDDL